MKIEQLQDRISKKEDQIAKIEKRITKWTNAKSEAGYIKDRAGWYSENPKSIKTLDDLIKARNDEFKKTDHPEPLEDTKKFIERDFESYLSGCDTEIRLANRDLGEANLTLQKYKNMLNMEDEKARTPKVQVIVDFLNNWKQGAHDYVLNNVQDILDYYNLNHQIAELWNKKQQYLNNGMTKDEWKVKYDDLVKQERAAKNRVHPWTWSSYSTKELNHINETILDELLEKEKEAKYWDLINRVTNYVGNIIDVSQLHIGPKGDLEGYVLGDNGKVHLETITAGGYNTDHIVNVKRGPILHYRTICIPVK